ncbi:MAG: hypothetical protein V7K40_13020 [Nostoc sp.]
MFHNTHYDVRSALSLLASRKITFELLISEQWPLKDLEQVFGEMKV